MSVNGISRGIDPGYSTTTEKSTANRASAENTANKAAKESSAAVYEAGDKTESTSTAKIYKKDTATVKKLLADAEARRQQMEDLLNRTITKQGQTFGIANKDDIWSMFNSKNIGKLEFSAKDIRQAQADVAEDGYWGVEQTSDRIVSFAFALTGGDPDKADEMMAAIEKGFKQATKSWGEKLPDISSKTMDAIKEKMDGWKNGTYPKTVDSASALEQ